MQPQPPTLPAEPFPGLPPPGPLQDQQVQEGAAEDGLAQGTPAAAAGEEASSSGADFDLSTWGSDDEEVSSSIWNSSGSFSRAQVRHCSCQGHPPQVLWLRFSAVGKTGDSLT